MHQSSPSPQSQAKAEAWFALAVDHMTAGHAVAAIAALRKAIRLAPHLAEAHANLGLLLEEQGDDKKAEASYRQALNLDAGLPEVHLNLGGLLARQKKLADAEAHYRQAIALSPEPAAAWSNLGALYACSRRDALAEQCCRQALALNPGYAKARFNLAYVLLSQGRMEEGWECLESRDWYAGLQARLSCPRWNGEALAGRSLLVGYEAGHGDVIQFCRYIPMLKAAGAGRITLLCQPGLQRLMTTLPGADEVLSLDATWPDTGWDLWTPLLSLPRHLGTRIDNVPAPTPYLHAHEEDMHRWAESLGDLKSHRVGLVWRGNPRFENDSERSLPSLALLAPLWRVPGIQFISLQKGEGEKEATRPPKGQPLLALGADVKDFADTAAIIEQLDLVISVDTAVAHLAGALGKSCWLLLPDHMTDWRWLRERSDSPWYPQMRLFRQEEDGRWEPVIRQVAQTLQSWAHGL